MENNVSTVHEAHDKEHLNLEEKISHSFTLSKWGVFQFMPWISTFPPSNNRKKCVGHARTSIGCVKVRCSW